MAEYCRTHGRRFDEHVCDRRPRLVEDTRFCDLPATTWTCIECGAENMPSPDHVCGPVSRSASQTGGDTPAASSAVSGPYSEDRDPAQTIWAEALDRSINGSRDS